jgi:hypothetical protein
MAHLCHFDAGQIDWAGLSAEAVDLGQAGRRTVMTILMLAMLAPVFGFYAYVFANFQKELRRLKKNAMISVQPVLGPPAEPAAPEPARQTIYQFESVYWGPLVVIPIDSRKTHGAQRHASDITVRRAG